MHSPLRALVLEFSFDARQPRKLQVMINLPGYGGLA